jgi:hypothetical protein
MKSTRRNDLIRQYFEEDMALLIAKGHDYAGQEDCLANLKRFGAWGIVVRLSDKFSRLESLTKTVMQGGSPAVLGESLRDTLRDIRNYAFLLQIFMEGRAYEEGQGELFKAGKPAQLDPSEVRPKHYQNEDEAKEFVDGGC